MALLSGLVIGILMLLNLGFANPLSAEVLERRFDKAASLVLDAQASSIVITGGGRDGITFRAEPRGCELEDFEFDFVPGGGELKITVKRKGDWNSSIFNLFRGGKNLELTLTVPRDIDLNLATSGGSIKLSTIDGRVLARTSGGSVSVSEVAGELDVKTSGGRINLTDVTGPFLANTSGGGIGAENVRGDGALKTSGGSIDIDRCSGNFTANTSGGGIHIDSHQGSIDAYTSGGGISANFTGQPSGDCTLKTSGGGITFSMPAGCGAEIDAKTSGGSVKTDFPVTSTITGEQKRNHLAGTIGGGGPLVTLKTSGGGISIRKNGN